MEHSITLSPLVVLAGSILSPELVVLGNGGGKVA